MIPPTIGRIVLVYRGEEHVGTQWHPGQIIFIHNNGTINVAGNDPDGDFFVETNLLLRQDDIAKDPVYLPTDLDDSESFACWMPYQRQQR